ncbi:hypothetical protein G6011_05830 [Alternaria panax]|uniref:Uncharacterized protein n=1 Tax=Alternaria panax TaxID=48097 RepID=A0AAD4FF78_9PLEO|nr:hypothetical protein G6011_05830 [Alternaria panax]
MGLSLIGASFCTANLTSLSGTYSIIGCIGMSSKWTVNNTVSVQCSSARLSHANRLIKLGGRVSSCVMAVALEALYQIAGIEWTFRIQGLLTGGIGLPAAWMIKDRVPLRREPFVDLPMFRTATFITKFAASAIGVFALFVPPYYLPLFAQSISFSPRTGAALVAAFNACDASGRFVAGPACNKIGPLNIFVITMALHAASMLAIWPVLSTLGPLILFALINGVTNSAYSTT